MPKKLNYTYGIRTISADRKSYGGFVWPVFTGKPVRVTAPDWSHEAECGRGLHMCAWGEGDATLYSSSANAVWQVGRTDSALAVELNGKVKAPWLEIVFEGARDAAIAYLQTLPGCAGKVVNYGTATAGEYGTARAGDHGTLEIRYWDAGAERYRKVIGYAGEDGVEPNVAYKLDNARKLTRV